MFAQHVQFSSVSVPAIMAHRTPLWTLNALLDPLRCPSGQLCGMGVGRTLHGHLARTPG